MVAKAWLPAASQPWFTTGALLQAHPAPSRTESACSNLKIEFYVGIEHFCTQIPHPVISGLCLCTDLRKKTFCLTALYNQEIIHRNIFKILAIYFYFQAALGNFTAWCTFGLLWKRKCRQHGSIAHTLPCGQGDAALLLLNPWTGTRVSIQQGLLRCGM